MEVTFEYNDELLPKRVDEVLEELMENIELPSAEAIQELIMRVGMLRCLESLQLIDSVYLNHCKDQLKDAVTQCTKMIRKGKKGFGVFCYDFV